MAKKKAPAPAPKAVPKAPPKPKEHPLLHHSFKLERAGLDLTTSAGVRQLAQRARDLAVHLDEVAQEIDVPNVPHAQRAAS